MLSLHDRTRLWPFQPLFTRMRALAPFVMLFAIAIAPGCGRKNPMSPDVTGADHGLTATTPAAVAAASARVQVEREADDDREESDRRPASGQVVHLTGQTGSGALWVIDKPAKWNGGLVVYLHGYTNPALPIALPANGEVRDSLMNRGFAVAASSYSQNGFAVPEGMRESHQLSEIFRERVARPRHTYLFGTSLGGLIGMLLAQKYPEEYDGTMLVCGIVGGSAEEIQYLGDIRVLFDVAYPGVLPGGLEHPPLLTDPTNQLVNPVLAAVQANPQGLGIIQLLARKPLPGNSSAEVVSSLINVLGFAMQGGGDLLRRTHGHSFFDNADWHYTSTQLPQSLIDYANANVARYTISPDAREFLSRFGEPSSELRTPVLTLHTTRDPVVPVWHEDNFAAVAAGPWLVQHRTDRYGHVNFAVAELMANFAEMVTWSSTMHMPVM